MRLAISTAKSVLHLDWEAKANGSGGNLFRKIGK
jgi:hypothetical protein